MVELAIKILAVLGGIATGVWSYPYLNLHLLALLAFIGAVAVAILAGALIYWLLNWAFSTVNTTVR